MTRRPGAVRGERGVGTVLTLPLLGVLTVVAVLLAGVGGALVGQRRAQAAADLAALAGATAAREGRDGCSAARSVAAANGSEPLRCSVRGSEVRVRVGVAVRFPGGFLRSVVAEARAGPVSSPAEPASTGAGGAGRGR